MVDDVKYICNKATDCDLCKNCLHSTPHEKEIVKDKFGDGCVMCTQWGECCQGGNKTIKVRCVKIK